MDLWIHESYQDFRGAFTRMIDVQSFGLPASIRVEQVNHSRTSRKGTVRGLHVQLPPAQEWKLVTCLKGSVLDVVVDLRGESASFGQWTSTTLSSDVTATVVIPPGCAHGFQSLEDETELLYVHTARYDSGLQGRLNPFSPQLNIPWAIDVTSISPDDEESSAQLAPWREVAW
jgi:dTDP-4-dehydrorhamnose 3,5-epimerase